MNYWDWYLCAHNIYSNEKKAIINQTIKCSSIRSVICKNIAPDCDYVTFHFCICCFICLLADGNASSTAREKYGSDGTLSDAFVPGAISNRTLEHLTETTVRPHPYRAIRSEQHADGSYANSQYVHVLWMWFTSCTYGSCGDYLVDYLVDHPEITDNLRDKTKLLLSLEKIMQIRTNHTVS